MNKKETIACIKKICSSQKTGVLSTQETNNPYASLVVFVVSADLKQMLFVTNKYTRKYRNITSRKGVSILIDNRPDTKSDLKKTVVIAAVGTARDIPKDLKNPLLRAYFRRHRDLRVFMKDRACSAMCVDVKQYYIVTDFQNVTEYKP